MLCRLARDVSANIIKYLKINIVLICFPIIDFEHLEEKYIQMKKYPQTPKFRTLMFSKHVIIFSVKHLHSFC